MAEGDLESCERYVRAGEVEVRTLGLPLSAHQSLELRLSRCRLDAARGRLDEAQKSLDEGEALILKRGDRFLQAEWIVEKSWLCIQRSDLPGAKAGLDELAACARNSDVGRRADLHWLRARCARAIGDERAARGELARAGRIWHELGGRHPSRILPDGTPINPDVAEPEVSDGFSVEALATLLSLGSRPRLLGIEAATLLDTEHVLRVRVASGPVGSRRIVLDRRQDQLDEARHPTHVVALGDQGDVPYVLQVYASTRPGAAAHVRVDPQSS